VKPLRALFCLILISACAFAEKAVFAQTAAPAANDPQAIWNALAKPAFDPTKTTTVNNLEIVHDRIRITLESGTLHFTKPINGIVTGAVFSGSGRIRVSPPNQYESQQLELFIKQDGLNSTFDEAAFSFSDKTFDEVAAKVQWEEIPQTMGCTHRACNRMKIWAAHFCHDYSKV